MMLNVIFFSIKEKLRPLAGFKPCIGPTVTISDFDETQLWETDNLEIITSFEPYSRSYALLEIAWKIVSRVSNHQWADVVVGSLRIWKPDLVPPGQTLTATTHQATYAGSRHYFPSYSYSYFLELTPEWMLSRPLQP